MAVVDEGPSKATKHFHKMMFEHDNDCTFRQKRQNERSFWNIILIIKLGKWSNSVLYKILIGLHENFLNLQIRINNSKC